MLSKKKNNKIFRRTALRTHKSNLPRLDLLRGGKRR